MGIIKHSETESDRERGRDRERVRELLMGFACALLRKNVRRKWRLEARSVKPRLLNFIQLTAKFFEWGLDL
jgi:hypothetical protein